MSEPRSGLGFPRHGTRLSPRRVAPQAVRRETQTTTDSETGREVATTGRPGHRPRRGALGRPTGAWGFPPPGGRRSQGEPGSGASRTPRGPDRPDPRRPGGPPRVFKPPRRDALGTWKGWERAGRGASGAPLPLAQVLSVPRFSGAGEGGGRRAPPNPQGPPAPHRVGGNRRGLRERGRWLAATAAAALVNDPSAGSPTETLLRLLLPLDSQVRPSSQRSARAVGRPRRGRSEGLTKPSNR